MANTFRWGVLLLFFGLLTTFTAFAEEYAATVIVMRGEVKRSGKSEKDMVAVKVQDRIKEGTVVSTGAKSFVKLLFTDNSQMNLGPNSTMKIERYNKKEAGVLKLIGGQLRAKVTKDVLTEEKRKRVNKLYIRTKTAALGVRGTEFLVTTPYESGGGQDNQANEATGEENDSTSIVSFEDTVAIASFNEENRQAANQQITEIVAVMEEKLTGNEAVLVSEGNFSAVRSGSDEALPAIRISPVQFEALKANENLLQANTKRAGLEEQQFVSPIPPGVDPKEFASEGSSIERAMETTIGADATEAVLEVTETIESQQESSQTDGTVGTSEERSTDGADTAEVTVEPQEGAPLPGGYVDLQQGVYVEPKIEAGAIYDPEQNIYIPDPTMQVGDSGELLIPEGTVLSESGDLLTSDGAEYDPNRLPGSDGSGTLDGRSPDSVEGGDTLEGVEDELEEEEEAEFDEASTEEEDQETANSSSDANVTVIIDI